VHLADTDQLGRPDLDRLRHLVPRSVGR
jgi:hypothetical protein